MVGWNLKWTGRFLLYVGGCVGGRIVRLPLGRWLDCVGGLSNGWAGGFCIWVVVWMDG